MELRRLGKAIIDIERVLCIQPSYGNTSIEVTYQNNEQVIIQDADARRTIDEFCGVKSPTKSPLDERNEEARPLN